jgi:hypothetical protein
MIAKMANRILDQEERRGHKNAMEGTFETAHAKGECRPVLYPLGQLAEQLTLSCGIRQ